jgi:arylsulfatase A-like enzyme/cytochrome c-type biogenesis protein CcmH/NrfG
VLCVIAAVAMVVGCGGREPQSSAKPEHARNVLLITIDTLRADAVGAYGNHAALTPALDALASQGTLFLHAYATAPITLTSHASILTGLYPPGHGARHNGIAMRADVPTLAERFRQRGVATAAFVSAFPLDRSFGLARGFEEYSDRMPRGTDGRLANERPGRVTVDLATTWLRAHLSGRFFAWVHLFEPHAPYGDPFDGRPARERYADEVAEADRQVRRLLDAVAGARSETLIVVAGDHGEAFGEHGEISHSIFVYDTTLRVPLIVAGSRVPAGVSAQDVSLADIAPTIARVAGLPAFSVVDGLPLPLGSDAASAALPGHDPYSESFAPLLDFGWGSLRTLRSGKWKYIAAPRPELYDVEADPGEEHNLLDAHRAEADRFAAVLDRISGPELPANAAPVDADSRRRLQALGYVSGSSAAAAGRRRDPKDARQLAASIALVTSGELRGAELEKGLQSILLQDPANPQANLRLGYVRIEQRRCRDARPLLERAISGNIPGADAYLGLATCQGASGDVRGALASLERARAREPQNPVVLANIGIALASLHEPQRAVAALNEALTVDPDLHEARFNLALVYARSGDRASARQQAEELLRRLPATAPQRSEVERLIRSVQ